METTICTFKLSIPFAQWAAIFDSEGVSKMHAAAGVKPLYRGISTEDSSKAVVIHQAAPGVATKLMEDNKALIESSGHIWDSTELSTYTTEWSWSPGRHGGTPARAQGSRSVASAFPRVRPEVWTLVGHSHYQSRLGCSVTSTLWSESILS